METCSKYDIVVCDRTVVDVLAYSKVLGFTDLVDYFHPMCENWIKTYDTIYFNTISHNDYHFQDGVRDTDIEFRANVEYHMLDIYQSLEKKFQIPLVMM
jgi:hypothetical protein